MLFCYFQFAAIEDGGLKTSVEVSRQSLFIEKPLNAFDVNFELFHSGVASLPGRIIRKFVSYIWYVFPIYFIHRITIAVCNINFKKYWRCFWLKEWCLLS